MDVTRGLRIISLTIEYKQIEMSKNQRAHRTKKIRIKIIDDSVNENELLWTVSSIILDELLKTKLKKKDVDTKEFA